MKDTADALGVHEDTVRRRARRAAKGAAKGAHEHGWAPGGLGASSIPGLRAEGSGEIRHPKNPAKGREGRASGFYAY